MAAHRPGQDLLEFVEADLALDFPAPTGFLRKQGAGARDDENGGN
jgi:hypothetical protein